MVLLACVCLCPLHVTIHVLSYREVNQEGGVKGGTGGGRVSSPSTLFSEVRNAGLVPLFNRLRAALVTGPHGTLSQYKRISF
jgi:hypothetical protein